MGTKEVLGAHCRCQAPTQARRVPSKPPRADSGAPTSATRYTVCLGEGSSSRACSVRVRARVRDRVRVRVGVRVEGVGLGLGWVWVWVWVGVGSSGLQLTVEQGEAEGTDHAKDPHQVVEADGRTWMG